MQFLIVLILLPAMAVAASDTPSPKRAEKGVFSRNWRGMLVDLACGSSQSADRSEDPHAPPPFGPDIPHLTLTDWHACPATAATSEFGLVFYSGRAVRLDHASNAKVAGELRRNPGWMKGESPPLAQIKGTLFGESLQVESMKRVKNLR
ncbi:MAG TPA: hypothetical protein VN442_13600 [Bryobacteraceae bacterium]|nr:hypothetical protein [Bryobacteraceae bacterium]